MGGNMVKSKYRDAIQNIIYAILDFLNLSKLNSLKNKQIKIQFIYFQSSSIWVQKIIKLREIRKRDIIRHYKQKC